MERKPLVYLEGDIGPLPLGDTIAIPGNFSYNVIALARTILIPLYQQMIVHEEIEIIGDLEIDGEVVIL